MPSKPRTHRPIKRAKRRHQTTVDRWGSGRGGSKWRSIRERIFERDGYQCQIHKRRGFTVLVTLHGKHHGVCDHITPTSQGGTDEDNNLQCICQACDKLKTQRESMRYRGGGSKVQSLLR